MASKEPDWANLHPWWKQALEIGRLNESFCAIKPKSPEFAQWMVFFRTYEKIPQFMLEAERTGKPVTLPSLRPLPLPEILRGRFPEPK